MIQPPEELRVVFANFESRSGTFEVDDVSRELSNAIKREDVPTDRQTGWWAEISAFRLRTGSEPKGGPWKTYFRPSSFKTNDRWTHVPDLTTGENTEIVEYWSHRAKEAKHPVLIARYADLVWDMTKLIVKKKPHIHFAHMAIDAYVAATALDDGEMGGDTRDNLYRALSVSLGIGDSEHVSRVVESAMNYVDRTAEDDKIGTYSYLFDLLLPPSKGPELLPGQEAKILTMFEERFEEMATPGTEWDADPFASQAIGNRLASYYLRKGRTRDQLKTFMQIALAFERRAKLGDPLSGLHFLDLARQYYVKAGAQQEVQRVQRESQDLGPKAKAEMATQEIEFKIPHEERETFLKGLIEFGVEQGLGELVQMLIPSQHDLKKQKVELAEQFPLQAIFNPVLVGSEGIKANVAAEDDPDGPMVFETARRLELQSIWLSWGLDHLIENGLTADVATNFATHSPLYAEDRRSLVQRGIEAHILGDYVQSIHVLVPQIERALVYLTFLLGKSSVKTHRSGKAVMQAKSLNDALNDETVREKLGENLRMYLVSTLSHPKGMNIRNEVCHGLWPPAAFNKTVSERVLHVLLAISLLRKRKASGQSGAEHDAAAAS